jgi:hypothetical protein
LGFALGNAEAIAALEAVKVIRVAGLIFEGRFEGRFDGRQG